MHERQAEPASRDGNNNNVRFGIHDCQGVEKSRKFRGGPRLAHQYGSRVKMNVVPVTIGALAPTNDTLTSLT